jgi:uncharacterized protein with von Willebrand factor type A (vWA) domain
MSGSGDDLLEALAQFFYLCRKNGLRVSTAEALDAMTAIEWLGLGDRATLEAALLCSVIKREEDRAIFEELFSLFFFQKGEFLHRTDAAPLVELLRERGIQEEEIERLLAILADEAARLSPTARMALGLHRAELPALIRMAGIRVDFSRLQNPMQVGFFTQRLLEALDIQSAQREMGRLRERLARVLDAPRAGEIARFTEESLAKLRHSARGYVEDEFRRQSVDFQAQFREQLLLEKPFGAMSVVELEALRTEVRRLAEKLRTVALLRPRRRRGRLDTRRTLRAAVSSGGVPFILKYHQRRVERPRLVVMCDISDSVRHVSRFMLQFAYTIQDLFSKVRSFVFVSDLGECTSLFRDHDIDRAVELMYGGAVIGVYANSNFGRAFVQFTARYLDAVTSRTTVIIIGDGRNNYHPAHAWALSRIRERARRVLWLNPEPPATWSFGDSVMREYEPHCDRVESVQNLSGLAKVIDSLVW